MPRRAARRDGCPASPRRRRRLPDCSRRHWRRRRPTRCRRWEPRPAPRARRLRQVLRKRRCRGGCRASARSRCGCRGRGSATPPGRARRRRRTGRPYRRVPRRRPRHSCPKSAYSGRSATGSPATGASGPSLARSSSGLRSSSSSTKAERSRFDSCNSLIACINCGVMTSDCDWRNSNLCVSAMEARNRSNESWSDSCLY